MTGQPSHEVAPVFSSDVVLYLFQVEGVLVDLVVVEEHRRLRPGHGGGDEADVADVGVTGEVDQVAKGRLPLLLHHLVDETFVRVGEKGQRVVALEGGDDLGDAALDFLLQLRMGG